MPRDISLAKLAFSFVEISWDRLQPTLKITKSKQRSHRSSGERQIAAGKSVLESAEFIVAGKAILPLFRR
jgi:hypothetical protein